MNGIVKRKKTSNYAQIHNNPLQMFDDLRITGLLAHLLSLPEDWVIRKTQLYSKFGRSPVTYAIKALEEKGYWIDVKYRDGKKNYHYYVVSDVPFDDTEALSIIREVIDAGYKIMSLTENYTHLLSIDENQQLKNGTSNNKGEVMSSSSDDFEQLNLNLSPSTVEEQQQQKKQSKRNINKRNNKQIVNINKDQHYVIFDDQHNIDSKPKAVSNKRNPVDYVKQIIDACNEHYNEFAIGRWNKRKWNTLVHAFATETVYNGRHVNIPSHNLTNYVCKALANMAHKFDLKHGRVEVPVFMEWLYHE